MNNVIFVTATGGINGGPNVQILATATPMDEVPFLKNESYATLTARPDDLMTSRANYNIERFHKSLAITTIVANRPGYPLRA